MTPDMVLAYIAASIIFTVCAAVIVFLFAYALAIWDTRKQGQRQ